MNGKSPKKRPSVERLCRRSIQQVLSLDAVAAGSLFLFLEGVLCIFVTKMYETRPMDVRVLLSILRNTYLYISISTHR